MRKQLISLWLIYEFRDRWSHAMPDMGLCCQRPAEDKENLSFKHRWPNGSQPIKQDSISSEPETSPRESAFEHFTIPETAEEQELSEELAQSPKTKESLTVNHLQVSSIFGVRKGSRTSSSGRSSLASVMSVQSAIQLTRLSSLRQDEAASLAGDIRMEKPRRAVSLRLPSRYRNPHEKETRLPTIYVDDPPSKPARRKSSLQRALSLLTLAGSQSSEPRPVQKILRQPTRRHHVRGVSGLPVSAQNTAGFSRTQTLYYPTHVPIRHKRTTSIYS